MKKYVLYVLCIFIYKFSISQESIKSFDFIICIDEEIATSITNPTIVIKKDMFVLKKIDINYYHPGNLMLNSKDYNIIFSEKEIKSFLKFDYYQYSYKGKQKIYNYEIEIGKNWFECLFVILKIYNLDKKRYRKKFNPLSKDKNYTFELNTSEGQMLRIMKKQ